MRDREQTTDERQLREYGLPQTATPTEPARLELEVTDERVAEVVLAARLMEARFTDVCAAAREVLAVWDGGPGTVRAAMDALRAVLDEARRQEST